jgi:hypothetical protein
MMQAYAESRPGFPKVARPRTIGGNQMTRVASVLVLYLVTMTILVSAYGLLPG